MATFNVPVDDFCLPIPKKMPLQHRRKFLQQIGEFLEASREVVSLQTIQARLNINLAASPDLLKDVSSHPQMDFDMNRKTLSYKPVFQGVHDRAGLLRIVQKHARGVSAAELADSYRGAQQDIDALCAERAVMSVINTEKKVRMLYPRQKEYEIDVDEEIANLWCGVTLPTTEAELERKLHAAGHLSEDQLNKQGAGVQHVAKRRSRKDQKNNYKNMRARKRQRSTNLHLKTKFPQLFN